MQLVRITGPRNVLGSLLDVEGLHLSLHSATDQGGDVWNISGYASDEAATELRRRQCTVTVVLTDEQVQAAIQSGRGSPPPTI